MTDTLPPSAEALLARFDGYLAACRARGLTDKDLIAEVAMADQVHHDLPVIVAEARREAVAECVRAIDVETDRLWAIARSYDQHGLGSIGLLVDMTNVAGGLDDLRAALLGDPE